MAVLMRKYTLKEEKQIKLTCSHALYILAGDHQSLADSVLPKAARPRV